MDPEINMETLGKVLYMGNSYGFTSLLVAEDTKGQSPSQSRCCNELYIVWC